jgi:hypothetical protein
VAWRSALAAAALMAASATGAVAGRATGLVVPDEAPAWSVHVASASSRHSSSHARRLIHGGFRGTCSRDCAVRQTVAPLPVNLCADACCGSMIDSAPPLARVHPGSRWHQQHSAQAPSPAPRRPTGFSDQVFQSRIRVRLWRPHRHEDRCDAHVCAVWSFATLRWNSVIKPRTTLRTRCINEW